MDVLGSFWQRDLHLVVLGEGLVVGVHEVDLKGVLLWLILVLEEMVLSWHLVTLVPVSLPLAEDWETWFDVERNVVSLALGVARADVANIVVVVQKYRSNTDALIFSLIKRSADEGRSGSIGLGSESL